MTGNTGVLLPEERRVAAGDGRAKLHQPHRRRAAAGGPPRDCLPALADAPQAAAHRAGGVRRRA